MLKTTILAAVLIASSAGLAHAGGQQGTVGVGVDYQLNGLGGISVNYDAGAFHVGGLFGFRDPEGGDNTTWGVGGRFYYHVHSTAMADFGIGGNLGIASIPVMPDNRDTRVFLEPGFQVRLFLAANVALSFSAGIVIGVVDAGGVAVTGEGTTGTDFGGGIGFNGGAGVHYYFF